MSDAASPYLNLPVPPDEMVKYIQDLMTLPQDEIAAGSALTLAQRQWGGDTPLARAALLRWSAEFGLSGQALGDVDGGPGARPYPGACGAGGGCGNRSIGHGQRAR